MIVRRLRQVEQFGELARDLMQLATNTAQRMMGMQAEPVAKPEPGDNRFKDPEWSANPFFDFCKQAYLLACKWAEDQLAATPGLDERARHRAEFYLRQLTSAYSPTNFTSSAS